MKSPTRCPYDNERRCASTVARMAPSRLERQSWCRHRRDRFGAASRLQLAPRATIGPIRLRRGACALVTASARRRKPNASRDATSLPTPSASADSCRFPEDPSGERPGIRTPQARRFPGAAQSCFHDPTIISRLATSVLIRADSEHDARERSTAKLDAPSASQALGRCKHESSSRAAGVALRLSDTGSHATTGVNAHQPAPERRARPERVSRIADSTDGGGRRVPPLHDRHQPGRSPL